MIGVGIGIRMQMGAVSGLAFSPDQVSSTQAFYDPSDLSTLFQDAAGSTPVTADGQAVRLMRDKSGNGHHAIAPSDAARPLYKTAGGLHWLQPDGTDDWMQVSPTLDLGETWWHVGGWRSDTINRRAFATSDSLHSSMIDAGGSPWSWRDANGSTLRALATGSSATAAVVTVQQTATAAMTGRYNGGAGGTEFAPFDDSGSVQGLALFSDRNTTWVNGISGRFYGGTFGTGTLSPSDRAKLEAYTAAKTGVTL